MGYYKGCIDKNILVVIVSFFQRECFAFFYLLPFAFGILILIWMWQMVDAWGGWSLFQTLLRTLKKVASKHGVSIPTVAVKYILDQVITMSFSFYPFFWIAVIMMMHSKLKYNCLIVWFYQMSASSSGIHGRCQTWFVRTYSGCKWYIFTCPWWGRREQHSRSFRKRERSA